MLPNLGGLAPTSGNAEGKRPMKAARPMPAPPPVPVPMPVPMPVPPQPLVGLPNDVLEVMVKHAAADARNSATPVRDMCMWMKNFCSSAKMQGAKPGCEDGWYHVALAVFGVTPKPIVNDNKVLQRTGFPNWRVFFGTLCEAFNHEAHLGLPVPLRNAINSNVSQRQIDTLLSALVHTEVHRITLAKIRKPYEWEEWGEAWVKHREEMDDQFDAWVFGNPSPLRTNRSIWMAAIVLVVMRGARMYQMHKYTRQDKLIILAALGPGGSAEAMAQRVEDIDNGNTELDQISVDRLAVQVIGPWANLPMIGGGVLQDDDVLSLAVNSGKADLLTLLLDRGALISGSLERAEKFFDQVADATMAGTNVLNNTPNPPPREHAWSFGRPMAERLIHILRRWLENHPDKGVRLAIKRRLKTRLENGGQWVPPWVLDLWYDLLPASWRPPPPLW